MRNCCTVINIKSVGINSGLLVICLSISHPVLMSKRTYLFSFCSSKKKTFPTFIRFPRANVNFHELGITSDSLFYSRMSIVAIVIHVPEMFNILFV